MIQEIVNETNQTIRQHRADGTLTKRIIAIAVEINQLYGEYLEKLETADFKIQTGVTVEVEGERVHFKNDEDFQSWVVENMR